MRQKCLQTSDGFHSSLHKRRRKQKSEEDDDEDADEESPVAHVEEKYRAVLAKYALLLEKGTCVQASCCSSVTLLLR